MDVGPVGLGIHDWLEGSIAHDDVAVMTENAKWTPHALHVSGYARGVRRAVVVLCGKDSQFWQGYYGPKFLAPSLRFSWPHGLGDDLDLARLQ
jgi:hypothetical protein